LVQRSPIPSAAGGVAGRWSRVYLCVLREFCVRTLAASAWRRRWRCPSVPGAQPRNLFHFT